MFCILDIESTGGSYGEEAIMEIAVYRYDGSEIVDQLISLVHPHTQVQKYVSKMTGITEKMLMRAPRFHELAKRLVKITEDAVLVGHNVDFDYRMLRQEFARLGFPYEKKTLDTIVLAEKLLPDLPSYGLNTICNELGIFNSRKHRADGDALATLELFKILQEKDREKDINIIGQSIIRNDAISNKIQDLRRSIKYNRGIYYLHDQQGKLLYVGLSDNIKKSLNKLFMADHELTEKLREETQSVKTELTGNSIVGKIKYQEELERAHPRYGSIQPLEMEVDIIIDDRKPDIQFHIQPINTRGRSKFVLKAESLKSGLRAVRMNRRYLKNDARIAVINLLQNFPKEAVFTGKGRKSGEYCAFVVRDQKLAGYFFYNLNDQIMHQDRLQKTFTEISQKPEYTDLLKLGILSGEVKPFDN